jgi:hypothetical protein
MAICNAKNMEIQYHDWRATCILATPRKVQFESELVRIDVDFQKDGVFLAQGLTSWPRIIELFPKNLPKHAIGIISYIGPTNYT